MIRCYITDRHAVGGADALVSLTARLLACGGADFVQIREKDLPARALYDLVARIVALANPHRARILVNTRVDIAITANAAGVHLPGGSIPPSRWRVMTPPGFLVSASCHSLDEVSAAEQEGADMVLFSPIFPGGSKQTQHPKGLEQLAKAAACVRIPVLALGGVNWNNASLCINAGAAGIAGISMFQDELHRLPSP